MTNQDKAREALDNATQSPEETQAEKLQRLIKVLEGYADDADVDNKYKYWRGDSGLAPALQLAAETIRAALEAFERLEKFMIREPDPSYEDEDRWVEDMALVRTALQSPEPIEDLDLCAFMGKADRDAVVNLTDSELDEANNLIAQLRVQDSTSKAAGCIISLARIGLIYRKAALTEKGGAG